MTPAHKMPNVVLPNQNRSLSTTFHHTPRLTDRESLALRLRTNGKCNTEIGEVFGLSEHTIRALLMSACSKLETDDLTHAVAKAIKLGLINISDIELD